MQESGKSWHVKFQELLKCGICLELYKDPKTLACQHSFCKECIYSAFPNDEGVFLCPTCRCPQSNLASRSDIDNMICSLHLRQSLELFLENSCSSNFEESSKKEYNNDTIDQKKDGLSATKCIQKDIGSFKNYYENSNNPENPPSCSSQEEDDLKKNSDSSSDDELSSHENANFPCQKLKKTCKQKVISKLAKLCFTNNIENDFNELLSKRKDCSSKIEENYSEKNKSKPDSREQNINVSDDNSYISGTSILGSAISSFLSQQNATKVKVKETASTASSHTTYKEMESAENNEENRGFRLMHGNKIGFLL
ncbi:E3 ubiquitin-protein ligase RNF168 isoform X1 [Hydra vulgaris]|uniref:E3 ubiquitin-protein ligase RNF168 isoform X1 n=1 Tax=Hydra vulgaris TaxID=6087 RepID=UPI00019263A1|nr:E3 ubiquitin-protein ligase RNF168 [Hydra vulgaris]